MPELKNNFTRGRMNKDLDDRIVPKGEYRDAANIQVSSSEGADVGAIESVLGNVKMRNKPGGGTWDASFGWATIQCIGAKADTQNEKIYWFITGTRIVDSQSRPANAILEYDSVANIISPIIVDGRASTAQVLNFSADNYITGINIFEGMLAWTDNLNEPRIINISRFKLGSTQSGSVLSQTTQVYGSTRKFLAEDITVIKAAPANKLTVTTSSSTVGGFGTGVNPVTTLSFAIHPGGLSESDSVGLSWASGEAITSSAWPASPKVVINAKTEEPDTGVIRYYQVVGTLSSVASQSASITISSLTPDIPSSVTTWEMLLVEDDPIFKDDFPRFSYRYKFADGQYSPMAPFSEYAFVPSKFYYSGREGWNTGMESNIRKITIGNFPSVPKDVDQIEVLYKSVNNNNIYVVKTVQHDFTGTSTPIATLTLTADTLGKVIDGAQLLRLFDPVPKKALAQEFIGNRLLYANYLENYDVPNTISLTGSFNANQHPNVGVGISTVKSNRKYQLGISFLDDFGRESPIFTNDTASVNIPQTNSNTINKLRANLTNSTEVPSWARFYKYYVKDSSNEFYNLGLDRYYEGIDGNVWLSFASSERNKVAENDFITLKKAHDSNTVVQQDNKYKITAVSNEAPEHIANVKTAIARSEIYSDDFTVGENKITFYGPPGDTTFADQSSSSHAPTVGNTNFYDNMRQGNWLQFSLGVLGNGTSKVYKIASGGPTGARKIIDVNVSGNLEETIFVKYEITLATNLDPADAWLANLSASSPLKCNLLENRKRNLPEFEGRFFAKIQPNGTFRNNVESAFSPLADELELDETATINALAPGTLTSSDADIYWNDNEAPTSYSDSKLPSSGSDEFNLFFARYDGVGSAIYPGTFGQFLKITIGTSIKFKYSDNTTSNEYYKIIGRVINRAPQEDTKGAGEYNRGVGNGTGLIYNYQLDRNFNDSQHSGSPTAAQVTGIEIYRVKDVTIQTVKSSNNPAIFETEPKELADLDIFYELTAPMAIDSNNTIVQAQNLDYTNCFSFGNGVESDRIRDDFNAPRIGKGVRVNAPLEEPFLEKRLGSRLIFSGIFNSTSGTNNLNQFLIAQDITKDLNPVYGSIQKLSARGGGAQGDLLALCEDKCFRILANKDALFEADGNPQLVSTSNVLGQAIPYAGEYGISKNPESFSSFGFRSYFTDKARGAVIRLSADGITVISDKGMSDEFEEKLAASSGYFVGSYDKTTSSYNLKLGNQSYSFKEDSDGWSTRLEYTPEAGISLNNIYYTYRAGELWKHTDRDDSNDIVPRANFYGVQKNTSVVTLLNDQPSLIKNFKTVLYEGDSGWLCEVETNENSGFVKTATKGKWGDNDDITLVTPVSSTATDKEGKYYGWIRGNTLDPVANSAVGKEFAMQGLGIPSSVVDSGSNQRITFTDINVSLQVGDIVYFLDVTNNNTVTLLGAVTSFSSETTINVTYTSGNKPSAGDFFFFIKDNELNTSGLVGYFAKLTFSTSGTGKNELFAVGSEIFISS